MRAIAELIPAVRERSGGRCELVARAGYRCGNRADEVHHRMPRSRASSRGDHLLDMAGVIHHLADLCLPHHKAAHAEPDWARQAHLIGIDGGIRVGLVVPGTIGTAPDGRLVYVGAHPEFTVRYPRKAA